MPNFQKKACSTKVLNEEALLWDPTPYPSVYHFWQKTYPFWTASIDKWYPFHNLDFCIPFNCCKCTLFKIRIDHKTRTFSWLFHSFIYKVHLLTLLGLYRPKWQFSLHVHIVQLMKSPPILIAEAWKRYPFGVEPPCISRYQEPMGSGHFREYPPWEKSSL